MEDTELLELIKENDENALETLIERYRTIINVVISRYKVEAKSIGLDIKDLYQEGLIGLFEAIKSYDEFKEAGFKTYATIVVERKILDLVKTNKRLKHFNLNNAISLDSLLDEEDDRNLYDLLEIDDITPITKLISEEDKVLLKNSLTEFELKVYELKYEGKSNREISVILDKNTRSIENTIQRIKLKFKNIIDNN